MQCINILQSEWDVFLIWKLPLVAHLTHICVLLHINGLEMPQKDGPSYSKSAL